MRHILIILSLFLFSLTIISCGSDDGGSSASTDNSSSTTTTSDDTTTSDNTSTTDTTAPVIAEVTAVTTPTNDTTPDYTFSSSEAGTITYGGSCSSSTTSATSGNNTITLVSLSEDTYSDCTITVTDNSSNSVTLNMSSFVIDGTAPTVSSIYPTDNQSGISITTDNITVTFFEAMDNTTITTNTDNTTCYGSFQLSSDNFSSCVQMSSSPTSSNSYKTFTVDPSDNLSYSTTYKIRVTTGVKDSAGNTMGSQYETSTGFTTASNLRLNIDFGAQQPDIPSGYAGAANQSGTWNKISSNSTNNLVDIDNVSTSISLEVTAQTLGGYTISGADLTSDNFYSSNGASWKVEITGISNGIYDIYYYAPANTAVSTGSFYINSALQNSISGSSNNVLSQGTDWDILSGVTVSNSTLTLESYSTSSVRGLAGLQIRPTQ